MKAVTILNHESTFQSSGLDSFGKKYGDKSFFHPEVTVTRKMSDAGFKSFTRIITRVNCRTDKVDIGPAFDWNKVISEVNS